MNTSENRFIWEQKETWATKGNEWSSPWGSVESQWYGTIFPRITASLPADAILELGCGFGRWTDFLRKRCRRLIVIDLSKLCIEHCRQRFCDSDHIEYHLTSGDSLAMIADASVDFVFSFDSLVHADTAVVEAYISQFRRILKPGGHVFLHHSNLGQYFQNSSRFGIRPRFFARFKGIGWLIKDYYWRDPEVSAQLVRQLSQQHRIRCAAQELVSWKTRWVQIDCFSTFVNDWNPESSSQSTIVTRNRAFMDEVRRLYRAGKVGGH